MAHPPIAAQPPPTSEPGATLVVIPNWNGRERTEKCLRALLRPGEPTCRPVLVDNGSTDGSIEHLREAFPAVTILRNDANLGFAVACNQGIRLALEAGAEFVWILNNDTEVQPGCLAAMLDVFRADAGLGAVGAVLHFADKPARVQAWGGGTVSLSTGHVRHETRPGSRPGYLTGACLLLRCAALEQVGIFDERYFFTWEDTDLCHRLRRGGWRLAVADGAVVLHDESSTIGPRSRLRARHFAAGQVRFLRKHARAPVVPAMLGLAQQLGRAIFHASAAGFMGTWSGWLAGWWEPLSPEAPAPPGPGKSELGISVVATVRDEEGSIAELLESLVDQTRSPGEVIVVDGGSRDRTIEIIRAYRDRLPLKWIVAPGVNISEGRNLAIRTAAGPIIACTDAGVRLREDWLAQLSRPFLAVDPPAAVAGFYEPDPRTTFEVAMSATVLPGIDEVHARDFLPSSRSVAFTKVAWSRVGGYPEWLDYCEDLVFDLQLRDTIGLFRFAPAAVARYRPRGGLPSFFRQYYRYARGDGKADLWRLRHAARYGAYLVGAPGLLALGWAFGPWWWALGGGVAVVGLLGRAYRRLLRNWGRWSFRRKAAAILWVPAIRITGDAAKMCGYPPGVVWRLRRIGADSRLTWRSQPE